MSSRQPRFNQSVLLDTTPLPDSIPPVKELGTSSAPLMSASFFIGARCKPYNDDYMKCKTEAHGTGEIDCMREGRKVTRCAASVINDINTSCLTSFRAHWSCLENNNQQMWHCRLPEQLLNRCVFDSLGLKKEIPGTPSNELPVHERPKQIFSTGSLSRRWPEAKVDEVMREEGEGEQQQQQQQQQQGNGSTVQEVKGKLKGFGEKAKEKATGN